CRALYDQAGTGDSFLKTACCCKQASNCCTSACECKQAGSQAGKQTCCQQKTGARQAGSCQRKMVVACEWNGYQSLFKCHDPEQGDRYCWPDWPAGQGDRQGYCGLCR